MARLKIRATRTELMRLKVRQSAILRGCELLTHRRDRLARYFVPLARENVALRTAVEEKLEAALAEFSLAGCEMEPLAMEAATMYPSRDVKIVARKAEFLSVELPKIEVREEGLKEGRPSYGFAQVSKHLDEGISRLAEVLPELIRLAETEKTCGLLADEIAKTRRRANALKFNLIPDLNKAIRTIGMNFGKTKPVPGRGL